MSKNNNRKNKSSGISKPLYITIFDHPLRHRLGLSTLLKVGQEDNRIEKGDLVSEVGEALPMHIETYCDDFLTFYLRAPRINKTPSFIFGSAILGDAFSAFTPKIFSLPAVGSNLTVDPWITEGQKILISMFSYLSFDVTWIIHVPSPLGTGIYLKVYAPEIDSTTETRGIRYKPSSNPTLAVTCPYSNDISLVNIATGRDGQSGGSIIIHTIEDNSIETLNTPLTATIWCCVHNIRMTGYHIEKDIAEAKGLAAIPVKVTSSLEQEEEPILTWDADAEEPSNEVTAEGGVIAEEVLDIGVPANPLAPEAETTSQPAVLPTRAAESKHDTGHLSTKWLDYKVIKLSSADIGKWNVLEINPYTIYSKGECFNLPWKRNVWTTGERIDGVVHTLVVQFNIARSPQISGVVLVKDSDRLSNQFLIQFGEKVEIPLIPIKLDGSYKTQLRYRTNCWLRTHEAQCKLLYKLIAFNRTADVSDVNVKIAIRPGYSRFQVPRKPVNRSTSKMVEDFSMFINDIQSISDNSIEFHSDDCLDDSSIPENTIVSPKEYITPFPATAGEAVTLHETLGDNETLNLDEFPVQLFSGKLQRGVITEIPMNLPAITDSFATAENAITQKFQRFAHIIPKSSGPYGPIVGNYTIKSRLPTGIAAEIQHICLPGDMADQSMILIFGLDSILSIAGGALSSIGGPLINGIVNTVAPVLSGAAHAIGGEAIGGLVDTVIGTGENLINGVLNTGNNSSQSTLQPTLGQQSQPSMNPGAISGDIPISRFVEFLKPVLSNYTKDPVLSTLLVMADNIVNNAGEEVKELPVQILANMHNVNVERNLFNRSYDPSEQFKNKTLTVSIDLVPNILEKFSFHPLTNVDGSMQNTWYKKFMSVLIANINADQPMNSISLDEVRSVELIENFTAQDITDQFKKSMNNYKARRSL